MVGGEVDEEIEKELLIIAAAPMNFSRSPRIEMEMVLESGLEREVAGRGRGIVYT